MEHIYLTMDVTEYKTNIRRVRTYCKSLNSWETSFFIGNDLIYSCETQEYKDLREMENEFLKNIFPLEVN